MNMELKNILTISGKSGLFKLVSSTGGKIIVESLIDNKKQPVSPTAKISSLEDIAIFTMEEDVPLAKVFELMKAKTGGEAAPDSKSTPATLRSFVSEILPDLDHDRVYDSDLKKLFTWFNQLLASGLLPEPEKVEKPKKASKKKAAEPEVTAEAEEASEEKED